MLYYVRVGACPGEKGGGGGGCGGKNWVVKGLL